MVLISARLTTERVLQEIGVPRRVSKMNLAVARGVSAKERISSSY
jgi:hypothetical protein